MHLRQVINIVVNGRHQDFVHSLSRLECVCACVSSKHMYVSPFSDYVLSQDIVVALCNYKNDRASIGFFNILDVSHKGQVVNLRVSDQGAAAMIRAQLMPFELLEAAQVLHWMGRMLMTKYNILATRTHVVKAKATVHNLWQRTTQQAEAVAQWLLGTGLPKSVPSIPYEAPSCLPSCPALEVDRGQSALSCRFEGCDQRVGIRAMRGHGGPASFVGPQVT